MALLFMPIDVQDNNMYATEEIHNVSSNNYKNMLLDKDKFIELMHINNFIQDIDDDPDEIKINDDSLNHLASFLCENSDINIHGIGSDSHGNIGLRWNLFDKINNKSRGSILMNFLPNGDVFYAALYNYKRISGETNVIDAKNKLNWFLEKVG